MNKFFANPDFICNIEKAGLYKNKMIGNYAILDVYLKDLSHYLIIYNAHLIGVGATKTPSYLIVYKETLK